MPREWRSVTEDLLKELHRLDGLLEDEVFGGTPASHVRLLDIHTRLRAAINKASREIIDINEAEGRGQR
jgi:hypothetical protein